MARLTDKRRDRTASIPTLTLNPRADYPPGLLRNQSPHFWHKELAYKGD
ncbi:MAG: hypothetical protein RIE73_32145 [Coleofasciculus sp. C1-SOL-03]